MKDNMPKLNELNLSEALEQLRSEQITSLDLVQACFAQIRKTDPELQVFITLVEEQALEQARTADKLIHQEGEAAFIKQPLLGVPYACKDNFCTKGIQTTASSNILRDFIPPYESTVTAKLKEAGAILLGKTNMDSFAHGSSTETSDFFTTKNPWDTSRVPGGSSGGSAAAVVSHMCIFAIGSETGGSIRGPASWCGLTGLKPSYGRVSRYGLIAMASSTDSPGPITKSAADAAIILQVLAGKDPFDATTLNAQVDDYFDNIMQFAIKGLKIGKPKSYFGLDLQPGLRAVLDEAVVHFEKLGAEIVEVDLMDPKYSIAVYTILQRSEVSSNLARFDGIRYGHSRDAFNFENKKRMMLGAYALSSGYYDQYYSKAQKVRTLIVEDFERAFQKVDVLIGPTMPCVALKIGESANSPMFGEMMDVLTEPSTIAGLTGITFPCGYVDSLPVGMQVIGPALSESTVLGVVNTYQNATNYHKKFPNLESLT